LWSSILVEDQYIPFIDDLTDALVAQGIMPELTHKEAGDGQLEFVCKYDAPLKTADSQIIFRQTTHVIARKHNFLVSFMPKVYEGIGSGLHMHASLWKGDKNITGGNFSAENISDKIFSKDAQHFIAGILNHICAFMAVTTPSSNSYRRILPGHWAGAYQCWGVNNKEAAVRVSTNPVGGAPSHFELKTVDASSNPYLAIGSVICAGLDGLRKKTPLPAPVEVDPGEYTPLQLQEKGIATLPKSLSQAIHNFEGDSVLLSGFGPKLAASFLAVRKLEDKHFANSSLDDQRKELLTSY